MTEELPIREGLGVFTCMLKPCLAQILEQILDVDVPFVWIRGHLPNTAVQWWTTPVCLSKSGKSFEVEVRGLAFDIQMTTTRFLERLPEFNDHGLELYQMTRRVPDTLTLDGLPQNRINQILIQNGLHLTFDLPHAGECAMLASPDREVLERVLLKPEVGHCAY